MSFDGSLNLLAVVLTLRLGALEPSETSSWLRRRLEPVSRLGLERRAGTPEPPPKTHTKHKHTREARRVKTKTIAKHKKPVESAYGNCHEEDLTAAVVLPVSAVLKF